MKTATPEALAESYFALFPDERPVENPDAPGLRERQLADVHDALRNWLARYSTNSESAIATQNWYGKVTKALFRSLGIKQPRTKREMLAVLAAA